MRRASDLVKTGIIAYPLDRPVRGGIDRYVHRLAREFERAPDADEFVWIHGTPFAQDSPIKGATEVILPESGVFGSLARRRWSKANPAGLEVMFGPYFGVLPGPFAKVMTVHDLYAFTSTDAGYRWTMRFRAATRRMAATCDWIITDSEASRRQVTEFLEFPADRTVAVQLGVDPAFERSAEDRAQARKELRKAFGWPQDSRVVLFVGAVIPRKDPVTLMRAFAALHAKHDGTRLLICGPLAPPSSSIVAESVALGISSVAKATGQVDDSDLLRAYAGSDVFVLPSLFEGFGLPVLEAMRAGLPTIVSTGGSLPEVAGSASLQFAPGDVEALQAHLERVLYDRGEHARLVAAGRERAATFTWARCAAETLAVLRRAAKE